MAKTFQEYLRDHTIKSLAADLGVTQSYLFKVKQGARPLTDHLLAHAWRKYGQRLDLEGSLRLRNTKLREDRVDAEIALVVMLAHTYKVNEGDESANAMSITLASVVRDMMGVDRVKG